ncbi:MAG: hypothetical protein HZA92_10525 [Verrucomicrobia bacterium]|nr:hypothetical protein [Verrucomicrobiota bacterium]
MSDTVRIQRPTQPSAKDTVRLSRPVKPATKDTVRLDRPAAKSAPTEGATLEDFLKQQKPHVEPPPQ